MAEKKQVLYDLKISYNGPFLVEEFYKEVDDWINENGYSKRNKTKSEHVTKNGKKIEWVIEAQSHVGSVYHGVVNLRVLMDNVRDVVITSKGKKMNVQNGEILANINGFLIGHVYGTLYQVRPINYFITQLIDKFVWNVYNDKYDGMINSQGRDLYKRIKLFFDKQSTRFLD